jgi:DNA-binding GntR family transcriptional regulator
MTISLRIREDLEARIASGRELPDCWTLTSLAERYGVSFTPVRQAVEQLVAGGYLLRQGTGRLSVNPARLGSTPSRAIQTPTTEPDWYAVLRNHVIQTSLQGESTFLREEATAERLGVGRTIVRQVFGQMVGGGLLEHMPRRGWLVVPFRIEEMVAYLEVREVLELKALELAWSRLDMQDVRKMLEGNRPGETGDRLDNRLHGYFIERSGNRFIREFFRTQGGYYTALFDHAAPAADVVAEMAGQHRVILEQVLLGKRAAAKQALSTHIWAQKPILQQLAGKQASTSS